MGRVFLACCHQLLLREKPSSFTNADESIRVFASLGIDLQKLQVSLSENSLSLQWCRDVVNLLRKMHFHLLCFVQKSEPTMLWEGVNCLEEYMEESLILLDFCNCLKSAISGMNRYCLLIDVAANKLHDEKSLSSASSSKNEIERLERESKNLYGIEIKGKDLNLFSQEICKTKSRDVNVRVICAVKGTMSVLCLLLFSSIFYPVSIKVDDGLYSNFPQLKLFSVSLRKLVCSFFEGLDGDNKDYTRPVLVENKMVESRVLNIKDQASRGIAIDEKNYLKSIDSLKNKCVVLKEGLERFESAVTELFKEVVKGRKNVLGMVTAA
ncbi:hypothetical protein QQP08_023516 [Theobroma cacao]|nr:hypothetical protein QQP08_023516 [Theobroma cacao]